MKTATYNKIILAATHCFSSKGFNATSIHQIAKQAEISQGAMYTYFKGKDDLIIAIVKEEIDSAISLYSQSYTCSAFERILQITRSCATKSNNAISPSLWMEIIAESSRNQVLNEHFIEADSLMRQALKKILIQGVEKGEFHNIDPEETSILLFSILDGLIGRKAIDPCFNFEKSLPSFTSVLQKILN